MIEKQKIIDIYKRFETPYWTSGKNVTEGWVNIQCPFCEDSSNHCGVNPVTELFSCWRCGEKGSFIDLLIKLTGLPYNECRSIVEEPSVASIKGIVEDINEIFAETILDTPKSVKNEATLPERFELVTYNTKFLLLDSYLKRRGLSIDTLIKHKCGICRSGLYMNRLIIPIVFQGKIVAFQAADMSGFATLKYKTSTNDINDYLYGYDEIKGKRAILVEGVLDAWRVERDVLATFGTHITNKQEKLILGLNLDELFFMWDEDAFLEALWRKVDYFRPRIKVVEAILLPRGHDPDSYGKEYGVEKLYQLIEEMTV